MRTFYTLMENLENIHLIKDVGMIPFLMQKEGFYSAYVVGYGKDIEEFSFLESDVKGLNYIKRKRYLGDTIIDGIIWIIFNAHKIDVLNLYHFKKSTFAWILVYKLFNRKGKVFVKFDIDPSDGKKMMMKKGTIKYWLTKHILGKADIISSETKDFTDYANNYWPVKVDYIPNGILEDEIYVLPQKEKTILTVGRLGTKQKATEILLEAFFKAIPYISDEWKLQLVGSVEKEFTPILNHYIKESKDRIIYLGEIHDRKSLYEIYEKAMIFTMSSRWEGFCLVGVEAAAKGCYLLSTNLISFKELTNNERYGMLFAIDDIEEYNDKIIYTCNSLDEQTIVIAYDEYQRFIKETYSFEKICRKIALLLNNDSAN